MKKKLQIIAVLLVLFLIITGCSKTNIGKKSEYNIDNSLVSISVKEKTLTNKGATFILENNTINTYTYGNPYFLEKKESGIWYELTPINDLFFTMPAYELKANETSEIEVNWEYGYGSLENGEYRLVKVITPENGSSFYVAAGFTIK